MSDATTEGPSPSPAGATVGYRFDDFRLDLSTRQLFRQDVHVPVSAKAFDTLLALVRRNGEVVAKEELIGEVWPDTFVSDDSLTQNISALRRILQDDPAQPRFIATVARRGYRFIAPVSTATDMRGVAEPSTVVATTQPTSSASASAPAPVPDPPSEVPAVHWLWKAMPLAAAMLLIGLAIGGALAVFSRRPAPALERVRFTLDLPAASTLASGGVLSPDGTRVAFVARGDDSGETKLWIRTLATAAVEAVEGSEGALRPFWSPDSRSVAFFGASRLRRVSIAGGRPTIICETVQPRPPGGSWNERDEILFSDRGSLFLVSAQGGTPKTVLAPSVEGGELVLAWPQFLPGGTRFIYEVRHTDVLRSGTYGASLGSNESTRILDVSGQQVAFASGFLIYVRDRQLNARRFDPETFEVSGDPTAVAEGVADGAPVSAAANGVVAFGGVPTEELAWFDRSGNRLGTVNTPEPLRNLAISPDGRSLLGDSYGDLRRGIWLMDLTRDVPTRVADGNYPMWLPDGRSIVYGAGRGPRSATGIYANAIQNGMERLLHTTPVAPIVNDVTRDGRFVVYVVVADPNTRQDIWLASLQEPRQLRQLISSPAMEIHAQVSPDGRWIAYASDEENGTFQVYIQSFPGLGGKRRVSHTGGSQPQWRSDGKELFYLAADQTLMSVSMSHGAELQLGAPRPLFRTQLLGLMTDFRNQYTPSPDGQRFVVGTVRPAGSSEQITLVVNWNSTLF